MEKQKTKALQQLLYLMGGTDSIIKEAIKYQPDHVAASLLRTDFGLFYFWVMRILERLPHVHGLIPNTPGEDPYILELLKVFETINSKKYKYTTICMGPRLGKSLLSCAFMLWSIIRNPESKSLTYSYNATVASRMLIKVSQWIKNPRFKQVFPYITIDPLLDNRSMFRILYNGEPAGELFGDGVKGTATGLGAGSEAGQEENIKVKFTGCIIIDDPLKAQEANSPAARESVWNDIETSILNRTNKDDVPIILIMQRLHKDDPVARLHRAYKDEGLLNHFEIKSYNEEKQRSICEAKISTKELEIKKKTNFAFFSTQYQQEPVEAHNKVFDISKIFEIDRQITWKDKILHSFITVDTAEKDTRTSDFSVFSHFYLIPAPDYKKYIQYDRHGTPFIPSYENSKIILLVLNEILVEKIPAHKIVPKFDAFFKNIIKHTAEPPTLLLIEEQACGTALIGHIKEKRSSPDYYDGYSSFNVTGVRPHTAKLDRLRKASTHISSGIFAIKSKEYRIHEYLNHHNTTNAIKTHLDLIENVKDNVHDDIADTIANATELTFGVIVDSAGVKLGKLFDDGKARLLRNLVF